MATIRGRGEGSVREKTRTDGSTFWEARVSIHGQQKSFCADTKSAAQAKARQARADSERGFQRPGTDLTVERHLWTWLEQQVKPSVRARTYLAYRGHVEHHLVPSLGKIRLVDLTPGQVMRMLARVLDKGCTESTARRVRATLSSALKAAMLDYGLTRNVASLAKVPKSNLPAFAPEVVTPADADRILTAFEGTRLWPLVAFSLATGLRQGELLALSWQDVGADTLTVRHSIDLGPEGRVIGRPKTERARRTVPLPDLAHEAMRMRRLHMEEDQLLAGDAYTDRGLLFANRTGDVRSGQAVTHKFTMRLKSAGLPHIRWHALRRVYAAVLQSQGVPIHLIRDLLGHSELRVTESYAYTMPADLAGAVTAINKVLGAGPTRDGVGTATETTSSNGTELLVQRELGDWDSNPD